MNGILRHILICGLALLLLIGLPFYATGYQTVISSGTDAVSSATVIIEQPSGAYVVFINGDRHADKDKLVTWTDFFSGREIGFLFEDISCAVMSADGAAIELARSFQSRLPENQMSIRVEDATLLLSKAYYGMFDVMLMSREAYEAYDARELGKLDFCVTVESEGVAK